jgi:hypothetical protein
LPSTDLHGTVQKFSAVPSVLAPFLTGLNKGCVAWFERLKQLRLSVYQAGVIRRQRRIRHLLAEIESHIASGAETNQRYREALDNLVQESAKLDAETRGASGHTA